MCVVGWLLLVVIRCVLFGVCLCLFPCWLLVVCCGVLVLLLFDYCSLSVLVVRCSLLLYVFGVCLLLFVVVVCCKLLFVIAR